MPYRYNYITILSDIILPSSYCIYIICLIVSHMKATDVSNKRSNNSFWIIEFFSNRYSNICYFQYFNTSSNKANHSNIKVCRNLFITFHLNNRYCQKLCKRNSLQIIVKERRDSLFKLSFVYVHKRRILRKLVLQNIDLVLCTRVISGFLFGFCCF